MWLRTVAIRMPLGYLQLVFNFLQPHTDDLKDLASMPGMT